MIDRARQIADAWIAGWNAHDIEAVLSLYREDATHASPLAVELTGDSRGTARGKDELRAYFSAGLRRSPNLRFELIEVFAGVFSLTMLYRNHRQQCVAETLVLDDDGKIAQVLVGHALGRAVGVD